MEKPILATGIDGILIESSAFIEPHKEWFDRAIEKTGDKSLEKWKGKKNYFIGVNEAMEKIMPNASLEERTKQAREWYQEDVIQYIKDHPEVVKREIAEKLKEKKKKYTLVLITTNTSEYINEILKAANLEGVYDMIHPSPIDKEPNKIELINNFIKKYGLPKYYLSKKQKLDITKKIQSLRIKIIEIDELKEI